MRGNGHKLRRAGVLSLAAGALAVALGIAGCTTVQDESGDSGPVALLRVIDASYIAPAANVYLQNNLLAGNIGQGTITPYNTVSSALAASVKVTPVSGTTATATATATLGPGTQHTILIADNGAAAAQYVVTVLEDQSKPAPSGQSQFRFLNQAPTAGGVDIYMVPSGATLAESKPLLTNLAVSSATAYIGIPSQTVTLVITPTGTITTKYTSGALALVGGEVRTVVIVDSQLTANPPVQALIANDVN